MNELAKPESFDWDELYRSEQVWSGQVNGTLPVEVDRLTPGTALDIGCGEGADAIWLAEQGWQVTGIDIAQTAIARAEAEASQRGLSIELQAVDFLATPTSLGPFDLVSLHYPAFAIGELATIVERLRTTTAIDGVALIVGHAPPEDPSSMSFDPADWVQPDDIATAVADDNHWRVDTHEVREREGEHHHDSPHRLDVVLRLHRR